MDGLPRSLAASRILPAAPREHSHVDIATRSFDWNRRPPWNAGSIKCCCAPDVGLCECGGKRERRRGKPKRIIIDFTTEGGGGGGSTIGTSFFDSKGGDGSTIGSSIFDDLPRPDTQPKADVADFLKSVKPTKKKPVAQSRRGTADTPAAWHDPDASADIDHLLYRHRQRHPPRQPCRCCCECECEEQQWPPKHVHYPDHDEEVEDEEERLRAQDAYDAAFAAYQRELAAWRSRYMYG